MFLFSILYDIIVLPIESIIEFVFCFVFTKLHVVGVGGAIVAVSLAVNFLALPIYNVADDIQLKERELQKKMKRWVVHIKTHFKGDEQFMMLSEYYRQNNYHPFYALRQSLSILIQIPFFMAAYHFLSHCSLLEWQRILFLKDLSKPDALIHLTVGGGDGSSLTLNLLPILMTAINVVSAIIYTKDAPLREKIQTFALAGIFLVLLYNSPSGLVFYWVLNQLFSLCKNVVKRTKNPLRIVHLFLSGLFVLACILVALFTPGGSVVLKVLAYIWTICFVVTPFIWEKSNLKNVFEKIWCVFPKIPEKQNLTILFLSGVSLCLLCGFVLPSSVIATSSAEFSFLGNVDSPLSYVWSSLVFFAGLFVFWPLVIYKMFGDNKKVKSIMPPLFFVLAICALANAFLFKHVYGILSVSFTFNADSVFAKNSFFFSVLPIVFLFAVLGLYILVQKKRFLIDVLMLSIMLAQSFIGIKNVKSIKTSYDELVFRKNTAANNPISDENENLVSLFHLSKTQKNVVVIFLDRGISSFFPYILKEFPELENDFDGFTYYPNCLSFGGHTNIASPALLGGYEYTAESMNKRPNELLMEKHNEALLLMPTLFSDAGFDVTVADLPYANYELFFDKDFFKKNIPGINALEIRNELGKEYLKRQKLDFNIDRSSLCEKRIKSFCILEILYPPIRSVAYNKGKYYTDTEPEQPKYPESLLSNYAELFYLPELTALDSEKPTFTIFENNLAHYDDIFTLVGDDYHPGVPAEGENKYKTGFYEPLTKGEITSYQTNASSYLLLAKWFEFLKANDCYDNTRIIVVADHGGFENYMAFRHFSPENNFWENRKGGYNPLLLVKDFDAHGKPLTDNNFITNAETPVLAIKDLPVSNINPFTKKPLSCAKDFSLFTIIGLYNWGPPGKWNPDCWKDKTQFIDKDYLATWTVHDNIFDESNWARIDEPEAAK